MSAVLRPTKKFGTGDYVGGPYAVLFCILYFLRFLTFNFFLLGLSLSV